AEAETLAALMQGGGFLLAALPPWVLALLHDLTGSFTAGWALHLAAVLVVSVLILPQSPADYGKAMQRLDVPAGPAGDAAPAEGKFEKEEKPMQTIARLDQADAGLQVYAVEAHARTIGGHMCIAVTA